MISCSKNAKIFSKIESHSSYVQKVTITGTDTAFVGNYFQLRMF